MKRLNIEQTNTSPYVCFDSEAGTFEMSGYSRPEDVSRFYTPIIQWLQDYSEELIERKERGDKEINATKFFFKMIYFNSSSAKFICDIIILLNEIKMAGFDVNVLWMYEDGDTEMCEAGEELSHMADMEFTFKHYN